MACWDISLKNCCHCIASLSCKLNYIKQLLYVVKRQVLRTVSQHSQLYLHLAEKIFYQILDTLQERGHFPCENSCTLQVFYKIFATCQELCIKCKVSYTILAVTCKKQDTFSAYSMHRMYKHLQDTFPGVSQSLNSRRLGKYHCSTLSNIFQRIGSLRGENEIPLKNNVKPYASCTARDMYRSPCKPKSKQKLSVCKLLESFNLSMNHHPGGKGQWLSPNL